MYTFKGKLKVKKETQVVNDRFKKREFVVTSEDDQYPQDILFQLTQDRCGLVDNLETGEVIAVSFDLRGREWNNPKDGQTLYFNSLNAWRIEKATENAAPASPFPDEFSAPAATDGGGFDSEEDDLPF